jgi:hypothetical protein
MMMLSYRKDMHAKDVFRVSGMGSCRSQMASR